MKVYKSQPASEAEADTQPAHPRGKVQSLADNSTRQLAQAKQLTALQAKGNGLPLPLRQGIEALSGLDMGGVRVHRNSSKPAQLQAHAYAQGNDIYLGPGTEQHLPHEAWHLVQQRQGRVKPTLQTAGGVSINNDPRLEHEADVMGSKAIQRKALLPLTSHGTATSPISHTSPTQQAAISIVQRKTAVAVTGSIPKQDKMVIDGVRVFDRTYPGEKSILGKKGKGKHRNHTLGWDLYKTAWEKRYEGKTIGDMANDLGCGNTQAEVEEAYANQIDATARSMTLYYGDGHSNMSGGQKYKQAKKEYRKSHDYKHSKKKLTKKEEKEHLNKKRKFAESALDMPTQKEIGLKSKSYKKLKTGLEGERSSLIQEAYDTDDEGL